MPITMINKNDGSETPYNRGTHKKTNFQNVRKKTVDEILEDLKVTQREAAYKSLEEENTALFLEEGVYNYVDVPYIKSLYARIANQYIKAINPRDEDPGHLHKRKFSYFQKGSSKYLTKFTSMINLYNRCAESNGYAQITPGDIERAADGKKWF